MNYRDPLQVWGELLCYGLPSILHRLIEWYRHRGLKKSTKMSAFKTMSRVPLPGSPSKCAAMSEGCPEYRDKQEPQDGVRRV